MNKRRQITKLEKLHVDEIASDMRLLSHFKAVMSADSISYSIKHRFSIINALTNITIKIQFLRLCIRC